MSSSNLGIWSVETPGLCCGKILGDCDMSTLGLGCDEVTSLGCDGAPGL